MADRKKVAPRGAIPNWKPAETAEDYFRNVAEGLEPFSERRFCKAAGWSRMQFYRAMLMSKLPIRLVDMLIDHGVSSRREIAKVAVAIGLGPDNGTVFEPAECCPNCGHVLRQPRGLTKEAIEGLKAYAKAIGMVVR